MVYPETPIGHSNEASTKPYRASFSQPRPSVTKDQIRSWELFGPASITHTPTTQIRKSKLSFKVTGIIDDYGTNTGWAILANGENPEKLYTVGAKIAEGVKIEKIRPNLVVINNAGALESLHLSDFDTDSLRMRRVSQDSKKNAAKEAQDSISENATTRERMLKYFSLTPVEPGADMGYLVSEESTNLIKDYDLKPGDVILSANGYPLGTESGDLAALQVYKNLGKADIIIRRGGESLTRSYPK